MRSLHGLIVYYEFVPGRIKVGCDRGHSGIF